MTLSKGYIIEFLMIQAPTFFADSERHVACEDVVLADLVVLFGHVAVRGIQTQDLREYVAF